VSGRPARCRGLLGACGLALLLAGCSAGGTTAGASSVTASGQTLKIYAGVPDAAGDPGELDVFHAEQLALRQDASQVTHFKLSLVEESDPKVSDDARAAIRDSGAIAYLGEIEPGSSAASVGITSALDLLQVSPSDTSIELTQSTPAAPGAPKNLLEGFSSYGRTFARVCGTTRQEAVDLAGAIAARGVRTLYLTTDGSVYGRALALEFATAAAGKLTVRQGPPTVTGFTGSGAAGMLLAANTPSLAETLLPAVASADPRAALFAPSGLYDLSLARALGGRVKRLFVSVPGFTAPAMSGAARTFAGQFSAAYGHAPDPRAVFGYEAMSALVSVLAKAGAAANDREVVVKDFFAIKNRSSALGTYSITGSGDSTIAPFLLTQLRGGALTPVEQLATG
jgi:ABC-type branched-subunit amino acid transport system substrate-binding protein